MASNTVIITAIVIGVIVASVAAALMVSSNGAPATTTNQKSAPTQSAEQITTQLLSPSVASAPALGSDDAKVTIVEFGDYQCTWCHRWHEGTKDRLVSDYVNTGKVRFLFKDFPINDLSDRASSLAAEASYCASDQGKYWEYHDEIYSNWEGENTGWVTRTSLEQFAHDAGVRDIPAFSGCIDSGKYTSVVRDNYSLARSIGLDATPSFIVIIEGETPQLMRGAHPYSTFERVINGAYTG
ncbi:MAG TPA: DsbA family protein [Nitrososphaera sp.]|jgi:protein-disulfide isomerase|nr:DsbA family protein [Nitrososphaera sp.]